MDLNMKIDLSNIDFEKIKAFLKRRETIIAIIVIIFIIAIIVIGNFLIEDYREADRNRDLLKVSYEKVISADTNVDSLNSKIDEVNLENEKLLGRLSYITQKDVVEVLSKIQQDTGVSWDDDQKDFLQDTNAKDKKKDKTKDDFGLKFYTVTIKKFYATYEEAKALLTYIENMDREVTIDSFSFSKDKLTGRMIGNMRLTFYYIDDEEAT